jgi:hypothetical protein
MGGISLFGGNSCHIVRNTKRHGHQTLNVLTLGLGNKSPDASTFCQWDSQFSDCFAHVSQVFSAFDPGPSGRAPCPSDLPEKMIDVISWEALPFILGFTFIQIMVLVFAIDE